MPSICIGPISTKNAELDIRENISDIGSCNKMTAQEKYWMVSVSESQYQKRQSGFVPWLNYVHCFKGFMQLDIHIKVQWLNKHSFSGSQFSQFGFEQS